jgi:hypothetical protein
MFYIHSFVSINILFLSVSHASILQFVVGLFVQLEVGLLIIKFYNGG